MAAVLETGRLRLAPYRETDEDDFVALCGDTRVTRGMNMPGVSEAAWRAAFRYAFTGPVVGASLWAVRCGGRYVGHAEIRPTPLVDGHEIVFGLLPDVWGNGLGTELVKALVLHGHHDLRLTHLYAIVDPANAASLAVLRRSAFRHLRDIDAATGGPLHLLVHDRVAADSTGGP